uniref:Uncharacterized protein n=1 Tax=Rhizophora mucronata TaxID=61149 RepID=A0A2P2R1R2_RHIMU
MPSEIADLEDCLISV